MQDDMLPTTAEVKAALAEAEERTKRAIRRIDRQRERIAEVLRRSEPNCGEAIPEGRPWPET